MTITTRLGNGIAAVAPRLLAGTYGAVCLAHADALRAAGMNGHPPPNASAIKKFVALIQDNLMWMITTTAGLAFVVIGGLFFFGHSRAQDYAARVAIGAIVVISASGLAA